TRQNNIPSNLPCSNETNFEKAQEIHSGDGNKCRKRRLLRESYKEKEDKSKDNEFEKASIIHVHLRPFAISKFKRTSCPLSSSDDFKLAIVSSGNYNVNFVRRVGAKTRFT
ncbi:hypothetical protein PV325_007494, partial [Microctonus aethiopoides]